MLNPDLRDHWLQYPAEGESSFFDELTRVADFNARWGLHGDPTDVLQQLLEVYTLVANRWDPERKEAGLTERQSFARLLRSAVSNTVTQMKRQFLGPPGQHERSLVSLDQPLVEDGGTLHDIVEAPLKSFMEGTLLPGGADIDRLYGMIDPRLVPPLEYYVENIVVLGRPKMPVYDEMVNLFADDEWVQRSSAQHEWIRRFFRDLKRDPGFQNWTMQQREATGELFDSDLINVA